MKETLEILVRNLVDNKDKIEITEKENGNDVTLELRVDPSDMGKVIGKQGKVAKSIRTVMKSVSVKEGKRANIEFVD